MQSQSHPLTQGEIAREETTVREGGLDDSDGFSLFPITSITLFQLTRLLSVRD